MDQVTGVKKKAYFPEKMDKIFSVSDPVEMFLGNP